MEATSLTKLLEQYPDINGVKVDAQGAEVDIVAAVRDWRNVTKLVLEYDFEYRPSLRAFHAFVEDLRKALPVRAAREAEENGGLRRLSQRRPGLRDARGAAVAPELARRVTLFDGAVTGATAKTIHERAPRGPPRRSRGPSPSLPPRAGRAGFRARLARRFSSAQRSITVGCAPPSTRRAVRSTSSERRHGLAELVERGGWGPCRATARKSNSSRS